MIYIIVVLSSANALNSIALDNVYISKLMRFDETDKPLRESSYRKSAASVSRQ